MSEVKRANKKADGKQEYRFYKSNLPKVVWTPGGKKALANFKNGTFTTDDIKVAKILLDKGYYQIPLDASEPPDVLVSIPGRSLGENEDVKIGALTGPDNGARKPVVQEGPSVR